MRKMIEAEGGRTGTAIEAEVGVRWKALKEAIQLNSTASILFPTTDHRETIKHRNLHHYP
jgi:hypothetical protein